MQDRDLNLLFIQREDISERKEEKHSKLHLHLCNGKRKLNTKLLYFTLLKLKFNQIFGIVSECISPHYHNYLKYPARNLVFRICVAISSAIPHFTFYHCSCRMRYLVFLEIQCFRSETAVNVIFQARYLVFGMFGTTPCHSN